MYELFRLVVILDCVLGVSQGYKQHCIVWHDATRLSIYEADNGVIILVVVLSPPLKQVSSKRGHGEFRRITSVEEKSEKWIEMDLYVSYESQIEVCR